MNLNGPVLAIIAVVLLALLLFLIIRNKKDRKELENTLNQDYKKPREEEHTDDPDDLKNT
jgi:hypothetical protein